MRWLLALAIALLAWPASAGDPAAAEFLFQEAMKLMDAGDYEAACQKLEESMAAEPSGGTALNMGRCYEAQGKTASAWARYEKAVTLLRASGEEQREGFAREKIKALKPLLATLTINADGDTEVTRNGEVVATAMLNTPVPIDPGNYTVVAGDFSSTITVGAGDAKVVDVVVTMAPEQPEVPDPDAVDEGESNALVIAGGVILGVGAVTAVIGGVVGGMVLGGATDAENDPTLCPNKSCTPEGRAEIDSLESQALASNILIGVGAAVAVGGAVMLIVGMMNDDVEAAGLVPMLGPDRAGILLLRAF